jgi:hypothetical protein
MWSDSITHCEKLITQDWQKLMGNFSYRDIPPIIISLADSDDSDDEASLSESASDVLSFSDHEQIGDSNMQLSGNYDMSENVANLCEYDVSEAPEVIIVEIGMNESDDHVRGENEEEMGEGT